MTEKFKGIVRSETMQDIVSRAREVAISGKFIKYWNGKNIFVARRKGVKYWKIWEVFGE